ncbi:uncharacterized protein ACN2A1_014565 isoform 1-T2 [Glossina fuscipes fuscipes]
MQQQMERMQQQTEQIESRIVEKIQENQRILQTYTDETYQQFEGKINVLEEKVDNALSQFDARLNAQEEKVAKVIGQFNEALKERAAIQQVGIESSAPKLQTPIIDDVLCTEYSKRQNKTKATARKCYNCDKVGHKARECKFRRKDSKLSLHTNSKAGLERKCHIKGYKSSKLPDDCGRQKHIEKTVITQDLKDNRERRMPEERNAKENIVVRRIKVETNVQFSKDDVRDAQLADNDLKLIIAAKKGERVGSEQIDKESAIANAYWAQWESVVFEDGCLWRIWYSKDCSHKRQLLVIPRTKSKEIMEKHHKGPDGEPFGVMKTVKEIIRRFYWVGCRKSVAAWFHSCEGSGKTKQARHKLRSQEGPKRFADSNQNAREKLKAGNDRKASFINGELVQLYKPSHSDRFSAKLQCNWEGPYKVITRITDRVYHIQKHQKGETTNKVAHVSRLTTFGSDLVRGEQD